MSRSNISVPNITFPAFALNGDFTAIFALENYFTYSEVPKNKRNDEIGKYHKMTTDVILYFG
ncbi:hypothetical protein [Paenibacillus polymyxa]|uniref:hypothetical protein n=1 Tax=Paenibacillus polymyxa TaxID=1406 RepID=UPI0004ACEDE6|nr:hypothetical protein [Paenibacillus polymyxa]